VKLVRKQGRRARNGKAVSALLALRLDRSLARVAGVERVGVRAVVLFAAV
jgi:hypothetical protein